MEYNAVMKTIAPSHIKPLMPELNQSQRNRIIFIDFYLCFLGKINRKDLMQAFQISPAVATRDFALYCSSFSKNLRFDTKSKFYLSTEDFEPQFSHSFENAIKILNGSLIFDIDSQHQPLLPFDLPPVLINPDVLIFSKISKALSLKKPLKISYHSISSGLSEKVIVPLALVNDGFRWHLRAFDRTKNRFADFVLTRIIQANILLAENIEENETINNDIDWNRIVKIELVPHPNHDEAKKVIEMDFGMTNGKLELALRASNIGYVLQQWRVDCSSDHHIDDPAFRLWLLDNLVLYGINNAEHLAPAFDKKRSKP